MSIRQACRTLPLSRTVCFNQPDTRRDEPVSQVLTELAERYPRYGFKKLFQLLRRQGNTWNPKRVHRIYCLLKLNFRRKGKQRYGPCMLYLAWPTAVWPNLFLLPSALLVGGVLAVVTASFKSICDLCACGGCARRACAAAGLFFG
ncbi:hypothetical protein NB724_002027 [Pantoea ananatis]|nr:hypothetical protein [Pantoea ananatis]MCW0334923.1 hypothetical protein [Pantoea ananatis]MCW0383533.1 hypothetical protein [Pantoea ananatis]MCW0408105.1 hypothetical protein [Pantoea ananatis]MCW0428308.1 hypothetical protein [Pantoea ananatis]